jgi:hypothetical protein
MKKILVLILLISCLSFFNLNTFAGQLGYDYKFPFRADEYWATDGDYGVHQDSTGLAIDFYARGSFANEVLSPADGYIRVGCTVNGAASLIMTTIQGDTFRFVHMVEASIPVSGSNSLYVRRGEIIGRVTGAGNFERTGCKMSSDGPHNHFSWLKSACNFNMQGFVFDCSGLFNCAGIGVYNVFCNRKYLNTRFDSTNLPPFARTGCRNRILNYQETEDYGINIELQKCLISIGMLESQYQTGVFGTFSKNALNNGRNLLKLSARCQNAIHNNYSLNSTSQKVYTLQSCLAKIGLMSPRLTTSFYGNITNKAHWRALQALKTISQ